MSADRRAFRRRLLILPPRRVGGLVSLWMDAGNKPPVSAERGEPTRTVRVIGVPQLDLVPNGEGYGRVKPAKMWAAVAQVKDPVVEIHPRPRDSEILPGGTELLRIDPVDCELALALARARARPSVPPPPLSGARP